MWRNKNRSKLETGITNGYTIVEVMIFLGVSGLLLVGALALVGGQQNRTEFSQSVRELQSRLLDIANDVATGYYPDTGNVKCHSPSIGGGIVLSDAPAEQGTSGHCIYLGKVIQFAPMDTDNGSLHIYTIAGQRLKSDGTQVTTMAEADATTVAKAFGGDSAPDAFEIADVGPIRIEKVVYNDGTDRQTDGMGFFMTLARLSGTGDPESGSSSANLVPIPTSGAVINRSQYAFVTELNSRLGGTLPVNPTGGVIICAVSTRTQQHALLKFGGGYRSLTADLTFHDGSTCSI